MTHFIRATALVLCMLFLTGCAPPAVPPSAASVSFTSIHPDYPEMAPYPNEMDFVDEKTGLFDDEGFSQVYDAWRNNRDLKANIPVDYADSLSSYFDESIPVLLGDGADNSVCSPLNIYMALALLAECTDGDSRQEILDLLDAESAESLRTQAQQVWLSHYCDDGASACVLANSLWLDDSIHFNEDTAGLLAANYYASVFYGDLSSEITNQQFRNWLNEQTKGLLEDQIRNIQMDPATVMTLASTIYYRAKWSSEFRPDQNTEGIFHTGTEERNVTFMNRTLTYGPYFWGEDFGAVHLRLEDGSKMWLILPDEGKSPADVLANGQAMDLAMGGWLETADQKSLMVNLSMPKFDVVGDTKLNDSLKSLGIISVFDRSIADFTPILPEEPAWLEEVKHAARVKVDEEGVEAAAYTVMMTAGASMPPEEEIDFILDRPFLFVITSQDDLPLFAGIVSKP